MKKYIVAIALVLALPLATFAAVKATGLDFITSVSIGNQKVSKWIDHDNGVVCYTAATTVGSTQLAISCVK